MKQQHTPVKAQGETLEAGTHARSYAAHTGHSGEQHMKPQGESTPGIHASATHPTGLRQPPSLFERSGKNHR